MVSMAPPPPITLIFSEALKAAKNNLKHHPFPPPLQEFIDNIEGGEKGDIAAILIPATADSTGLILPIHGSYVHTTSVRINTDATIDPTDTEAELDKLDKAAAEGDRHAIEVLTALEECQYEELVKEGENILYATKPRTPDPNQYNTNEEIMMALQSLMIAFSLCDLQEP